MRFFLDSNVIFSAARSPDGRGRALFLLANRGMCDLVSSPHGIAEARRNIELNFPDHAGELEELVEQIDVVAEAAQEEVAWALVQSLPAGTAPILAAAVGAKVDFLVTGDRTLFGHLCGKTLRGVKVVLPEDALEEVIF
jgi:predicted nucleic acid-binding protein